MSRIVAGAATLAVAGALSVGAMISHIGSASERHAVSAVAASASADPSPAPSRQPIPNWTFTDPGQLTFTPVPSQSVAGNPDYVAATELVAAEPTGLGMSESCICWLIEFQTGEATALGVTRGAPPLTFKTSYNYALYDAKTGAFVAAATG